uniref:Uncharacterized protein n=1 Tax=Arundo donax TaxID=35708 RepID=A0A0A8ZQ38_ARUDO
MLTSKQPLKNYVLMSSQ